MQGDTSWIDQKVKTTIETTLKKLKESLDKDDPELIYDSLILLSELMQSLPSEKQELPQSGLSTDDGSSGIKGNLFEALQKTFSIKELQDKVLYVCGPPIMMETLTKFSKDNNIECYLALETIMACGIGICQGCTLETNITSKTEHSYRNKYELVCMDGPIYNAKKVKTCLL